MIYSFTFNIVRIAKEPTEMVGAPGLEPETSSLSETRSNQLSYAPALHSENLLFHKFFIIGGAGGIRTRDILLAKQALYL